MSNDINAIVQSMRKHADHVAAMEHNHRVHAARLLGERGQLKERIAELERQLIAPLPIGELIERLENQTNMRWFSEVDLPDEITPETAQSVAKFDYKMNEDELNVAADMWNAYRSTALSALPSREVLPQSVYDPEKWKLVPIKALPEQIEAARCSDDASFETKKISLVYVNNQWSARQYYKACIEVNDSSALKAAMIVFLMMQDEGEKGEQS